MTTRPSRDPSSFGVSREAFLAAIRSAVHRDKPPTHTGAPAPRPVDERLARLVAPTDDLRALFLTRAAAGGARVITASEWSAALTAELLSHAAARPLRITLSVTDPALRAALQSLLTTLGHTVLSADGAAHQFTADLGITDVHAALAETGSLVMTTSPGAPRATALVPPLHVALVFERQLRADLLDLFTPGAPLPTTLTIVSGPSKTADIEGILITGVHGPAELLIILAAS